MKTTKEKIEVMQAFADGKKIEVTSSLTSDDWRDCSLPLWEWGCYDYRIKQELPTIDGYELVPADSDEKPKMGWKFCGSGEIFDVYDDFLCSVKDHCAVGRYTRFYRPIRKLKMPDGVFWVRRDDNSNANLVQSVSSNNNAFQVADTVMPTRLSETENLQWSHDRVTWYNFYGEKV